MDTHLLDGECITVIKECNKLDFVDERYRPILCRRGFQVLYNETERHGNPASVVLTGTTYTYYTYIIYTYVHIYINYIYTNIHNY